jgi:hypothetical protein
LPEPNIGCRLWSGPCARGSDWDPLRASCRDHLYLSVRDGSAERPGRGRRRGTISAGAEKDRGRVAHVRLGQPNEAWSAECGQEPGAGVLTNGAAFAERRVSGFQLPGFVGGRRTRLKVSAGAATDAAAAIDESLRRLTRSESRRAATLSRGPACRELELYLGAQYLDCHFETVGSFPPSNRANFGGFRGCRHTSKDRKRVFVTFCGANCQGRVFRAEEGMRKKIKVASGPRIKVSDVKFRDAHPSRMSYNDCHKLSCK